MKEVISVSLENSKMGPVPSFSLTPVATCAKECECGKKGCYAKTICNRWRTVRNAWAKNWRVAKDAKRFEEQMNGWLAVLRPPVFRIHVGGDFFSEEYLKAWCRIAKANKTTKFFCFTKQFGILRKCARIIPKNLSVILSAWLPSTKGWCPPEDLMKKFPVAWVVNNHPGKGGTDDLDEVYRVTHDRNVGGHSYDKIRLCGGHCASCGMCFNLRRKNGDVMFELHK